MSHLLTSKLAETIYTSIEGLPIVDYHTHLPADEILNDHQFENIWELWLKHDHYKWRLMRGCGVEEKFITGDASPYEKFHAFASILPLAIGNPVHQWAHMELEKIFNITIPLNAETAEGIWNQTNSELSDNTTVSKLLQLFKVKLIATTDDPFDDLSSHKSIAAKNHPTQVLPTFRPDKHLFEDKIDLSSLKQRHDYFHAHGCQMSDHGLSQIPAPETPQYQALKSIAQWNHEKGWIMQLHLGPQREVNTRLSKRLITTDRETDSLPQRSRSKRPTTQNHPLQPQSEREHFTLRCSPELPTSGFQTACAPSRSPAHAGQTTKWPRARRTSEITERPRARRASEIAIRTSLVAPRSCARHPRTTRHPHVYVRPWHPHRHAHRQPLIHQLRPP
ncbi:MAG: hypothetical protein GWP68_09775 [Verrucomicrobiaceae bacterium]|nr:hypothetical protein [Verrucomicrobiaceae bacterium]